ncbi:unknown protein [Desulfotalea psychrophila LSv54]|uniref:Uncharacterized protein n=2 Tax=Desulfotalea psychrophila TaxID=84980 RepID=Q6AKX3_DESPS|nr:unknown protein [Desulfotalea psychrophila LSv54]
MKKVGTLFFCLLSPKSPFFSKGNPMPANTDYSKWPCPHCGSFRQEDASLLPCEDWAGTIRRSQYKIVMEYAAFAYRYGHMFRSIYEIQLESEQAVTPGSLSPAHPVAIGASLVILSALHGSTVNWFLIQEAVKKMATSYGEVYGEECVIEEGELKRMNKNLREFTQDFSGSLPALRNAIFEEIFAEHCAKKDHDKLLQLQNTIRAAKADQQKALLKDFDDLLQKIMGKTFKMIAKQPKPEPAELATYWSKVLEADDSKQD